MIGKINGHAVASAKGINDGTERAVSNEERLNMLLQQARQMFQDISPNNWTPTKLACAEIDKLREQCAFSKSVIDTRNADIEFLSRVRAAQGEMIGKIHAETLRLSAENDWLKRPLWVKIVGWFATVKQGWAP